MTCAPTVQGHSGGWDTSPPDELYVQSILQVDDSLGRIMDAIRTNADLNGHTVIILTADHGGLGTGHSDASDPETYTIPFLVWFGDGNPTHDLYAFNPTSRTDPGTGRPLDAQAAPHQISLCETQTVAIWPWTCSACHPFPTRWLMQR